MIPTRCSRTVRTVTLGLTVLATVGLATVASASATTKDVVLYYSFDHGRDGGSSTRTIPLDNDGDGAVSASVVSSNGGTLTRTASRPGQGDGARFPAFDPGESGSRAVVEIQNRTGTDVLAPGSRDFAWSVAFKVDAQSSDHSGSSYDDGDNLFQRGLYNDDQYKLDVDDHQPGCRLQGSTGDAGAVRVVAPMTVAPNTWYRATCNRWGDRLTITVVAFDADGTATRSWTNSETSSVGFGSLEWKDADTPVTIGGKLTADATPADGSTDQFNGVVDNPQLRIYTN
jgi:hypothetical protein